MSTEKMEVKEVKVEEISDLNKTNRRSQIISVIINVMLVVAIIVAAICTYASYVSTSGNGVPSIMGIRILSVQTESMYPVLEPGDLIFSTAVEDSSELVIGDIITYWTVIDGERVLNTHRITGIYDGGGYLIFATKGDNNTLEDALTVHESEVVGKYAGKLSGVGKVFDYLQTSTGFLLVVVLPVFLFFIFHLIQFFRVLFEYQNIKNKIKYEQERGKTEEMVLEQRSELEDIKEKERDRIAAELREQLKAELLESMRAEVAKEETKEETKVEENAQS